MVSSEEKVGGTRVEEEGKGEEENLLLLGKNIYVDIYLTYID